MGLGYECDVESEQDNINVVEEHSEFQNNQYENENWNGGGIS